MNILKDLHNPTGKRTPFSSERKDSFKSSRADITRREGSPKNRVSSPLPSEGPKFQGLDRSSSARPEISMRESSSRPSGASRSDLTGNRTNISPKSQQSFAPVRQGSLRHQLTKSSDAVNSRANDVRAQNADSSDASSSKSWWKLKKK